MNNWDSSDELEIIDIDNMEDAETHEVLSETGAMYTRPLGLKPGWSEAYDPVIDEQHRAEEEPPRARFRISPHILILVAILIILAVAIARFLIWNRGVETQSDGSGDDKFLVEVNDNMVLLSESKLEGHKDDGKTTVLCLGNAPFSDDTSEKGLAGQIARIGNVTTINASFPNSQVTCLNPKYDPSDMKGMDDIFNLFYVSYAISLGDYTSLETVAGAHPDDPRYAASVEALRNTDFNKVDIIAIMYDAVDYQNDMPIVNEGYEDELTTYVGSLKNACKLIQERYPFIRIVFMSPTYMLYEDEDGDFLNGRTTDIGNGTLIQYWQWAFDTCGSQSVSFLDNYYGSVNDDNYEKYLKDNVHLNEDGFIKVADHFVYKVIQEEYAEYDANRLMVEQ